MIKFLNFCCTFADGIATESSIYSSVSQFVNKNEEQETTTTARKHHQDTCGGRRFLSTQSRLLRRRIPIPVSSLRTPQLCGPEVPHRLGEHVIRHQPI